MIATAPSQASALVANANAPAMIAKADPSGFRKPEGSGGGHCGRRLDPEVRDWGVHLTGSDALPNT